MGSQQGIDLLQLRHLLLSLSHPLVVVLTPIPVSLKGAP